MVARLCLCLQVLQDLVTERGQLQASLRAQEQQVELFMANIKELEKQVVNEKDTATKQAAESSMREVVSSMSSVLMSSSQRKCFLAS